MEARRRAFPALALTALFVTAAGCLAPGVAESSTEAVAPGAAPPSDPTPTPQVGAPEPGPAPPATAPDVATWEGHILVGALLEFPAHLTATAGVVDPIWRSGVTLDLNEIPQDVQLSLDWNGTGLVEIMMYPPNSMNASDQLPSYESGYTSVHHSCMRVPPEDLMAGHWDVMVHSYYGAQIAFRLTATTRGGNVTFLSGPHAPPRGADSPETAIRQVVDDERATLACDEGV